MSLPLEILKVYRSPQGWAFCPVHYSADPEKDDAWFQRERAKYATDEDWNREQEIDFTLKLGAAAYPNFFTSIHVAKEPVPLIETLPLLLAVDFNVSPMIWLTCQIVHGWLRVLRQVKLDPASVELMCEEFRNIYPQHRGELVIYGDATGKARNAQTARSNYDLMAIGLRGYRCARIGWRVPEANPLEKDRIAAVNLKLRPPTGMPGILISPDAPDLIEDLQQVVWRPDGQKILKIYNSKDPYSKRTHASDDLGYLVFREWPTISEKRKILQGPRLPAAMKPGKLLGEIQQARGRRR